MNLYWLSLGDVWILFVWENWTPGHSLQWRSAGWNEAWEVTRAIAPGGPCGHVGRPRSNRAPAQMVLLSFLPPVTEWRWNPGEPTRNVAELLFLLLGVVILVIWEVGVNLKYYRRDFTGAFSASRLFLFFLLQSQVSVWVEMSHSPGTMDYFDHSVRLLLPGIYSMPTICRGRYKKKVKKRKKWSA